MAHDLELASFRHNVTSQFGEDGVLEKLFGIIGVDNRWCVEFGAGDGEQNSNSWNCINNHSWSAVLIEADRSEYEHVYSRYAGNDRVTTIHAAVERDGPAGLASLLGRSAIPHEFDLLVVDIDGDDYHVWQAFDGYRPRVVMVEYNHTIPFDVRFVQAYQAPVRGGASLSALRHLGEQKGYVLVYAAGVNALFVDRSIAERAGLEAVSETALAAATADPHPYFQLYDGSIVLWGDSEAVARRARERKYVVAPVWLGGGNALTPIVFSRESPWARRAKERAKRSTLYPKVRAFYDRWMRKPFRRARRILSSRAPARHASRGDAGG